MIGLLHLHACRSGPPLANRTSGPRRKLHVSSTRLLACTHAVCSSPSIVVLCTPSAEKQWTTLEEYLGTCLRSNHGQFQSFTVCVRDLDLTGPWQEHLDATSFQRHLQSRPSFTNSKFSNLQKSHTRMQRRRFLYPLVTQYSSLMELLRGKPRVCSALIQQRRRRIPKQPEYRS